MSNIILKIDNYIEELAIIAKEIRASDRELKSKNKRMAHDAVIESAAYLIKAAILLEEENE